MTDRALHLAERLDRANVSAAALRELESAFAEVKQACMERAMALASEDPTKRDAEAILNLSLFVRAIDEAHNVLSVRAKDGRAAHDELAYLRKVERMSPERRRWADLAGPIGDVA